MIERATAYKSSDGAMFNELAACQKHEIEILWPHDSAAPEQVAIWVMENAVKIVDVLTTNAKSRPKARKVNKKKVIQNENKTQS